MPSVMQKLHESTISDGPVVALLQSPGLQYRSSGEECIEWGEKIQVSPIQKQKWDAFWNYAIELSSRLP